MPSPTTGTPEDPCEIVERLDAAVRASKRRHEARDIEMVRAIIAMREAMTTAAAYMPESAQAKSFRANTTAAARVTRAFAGSACPSCALAGADGEHIIACVQKGDEESSVDKAMTRTYLARDAPGIPDDAHPSGE